MTLGLRPAQYLRAAIDGLPTIQDDVAHSVVAVQLNSVKLSQLDGVGVPNGGHAGAHVKPSSGEIELTAVFSRVFELSWSFFHQTEALDKRRETDLNSKRPPTSPSETKSAPVVLLCPL